MGRDGSQVRDYAGFFEHLTDSLLDVSRPDRPLGAPASTPRPAPTGGGFSCTGPAVRRFFHMDGESIALAVLWELARAGKVPQPAAQATARYKLDLPVSEALS